MIFPAFVGQAKIFYEFTSNERKRSIARFAQVAQRYVDEGRVVAIPNSDPPEYERTFESITFRYRIIKDPEQDYPEFITISDTFRFRSE